MKSFVECLIFIIDLSVWIKVRSERAKAKRINACFRTFSSAFSSAISGDKTHASTRDDGARKLDIPVVDTNIAAPSRCEAADR